MKNGKLIIDEKMIKATFILCWIVYFANYIGRLNYSASMSEIMTVEGLTKSQGGVIATGFFIMYGIGQFINGYLGDKVNPKIMITVGMIISGICNLLFSVKFNFVFFVILWCINGYAQSMLWAPIVKIFSTYFAPEYRLKACVNIQSTVAVGTLVVYLLSGFFIFIGNWKLTFLTASILLFITALVWVIGMKKIDRNREVDGIENNEIMIEPKQQSNENHKKSNFFHIAVISGLIFFIITSIIFGALKDGVASWTPTYISDTFYLPNSVSIILTTILPIVNLIALYGVNYLDKKFIKDEILTCIICFVFGGISLGLLYLFGEINVAFSLLLLAITTSMMFSISTVLTGIVPLYFSKYNKTSTVSGIISCAVYAGTSISIYGIGVLTQIFSWSITILCLTFVSVFGILACVIGWIFWKKFKNQN